MSIFGKITLGSDPEIFVTKDGKPIGAATTGIGGTKEKPKPLEGGGAVQIDGMALEFNIEPASNSKEWVENHNKVLNQLRKMLPDGYNLDSRSCLDFTDYIDNCNPTEEETIFGCDPDHNADTMKENTMPDNDGSIKFRTTGGHIHIGMEHWGDLAGSLEIQHLMAQKIVFALDATIGLMSIKSDIEGGDRRKLYGNAGAYRIKPYGIEYRSLSNFWVFDEELMEFYAGIIFDLLGDDKGFTEMVEIGTKNRELVVDCINNGNVEKAKEFVLGDKYA